MWNCNRSTDGPPPLIVFVRNLSNDEWRDGSLTSRPCILIFDSLATGSRSRVVATLRDYLQCEYDSKVKGDRKFDKDTIKGCSPRVPQQPNFSDCGIFVLQYCESFFKVTLAVKRRAYTGEGFMKTMVDRCTLLHPDEITPDPIWLSIFLGLTYVQCISRQR